MGPADRRLAKVSLQDLTHVQLNDIEKGLPVEYRLQLKFLEI